MNQIINMIMRMVMRQAISKGINMGVNKMSKGRNRGPDQDQQPPAHDDKSMRQSAKMARRLNRF